MILLNHAELSSVALQSNTELIFKSLVLRFHADPAPQNINTYRYCGTVLNIKPNNSYLRKNIFPFNKDLQKLHKNTGTVIMENEVLCTLYILYKQEALCFSCK